MFDWDDLRYLLAISRNGSLTAAARALGVTQPTMSRRMEHLEARLGAELFERQPTGVLLNPLGTSLLGMAEQMEQAALAAERRLAARGTGLEGTVRLTTLEWIGQHLLAPILASFCRQHPGITVELLTADRILNLARHEADLAVRVMPFDQDSLVQRRLSTLPYALFASEPYLAERGAPDFAAGCPGHMLVTFTETAATFPQVHWLRHRMAPRAQVAVTSNSLDVQLVSIMSGAGFGALPERAGASRPILRRLEAPEPPPGHDIWLGYHEDLRHTPRVRALADHIAAEMKR